MTPAMTKTGRARYPRIYDLVRQIPAGRVATYGQIAGYVPGTGARQVGYAMAALDAASDVPWQRVINARGEISLRPGGDGHFRQRALLEAEGVVFDGKGRIDLGRFRWPGPPPQWLADHGYALEALFDAMENSR